MTLLIFGCAVIASVAVLGALELGTRGGRSVGATRPAFAENVPLDNSVVLPDRTSCADIGRTDLRSPAEGVWVEANCVTMRFIESSTSCNRTSVDAPEFVERAPQLYVFRGATAHQAYLWFESAAGCYDLVSSRSITAVCSDRTVTFSWDADACAGHGGVLFRVNGR